MKNKDNLPIIRRNKASDPDVLAASLADIASVVVSVENYPIQVPETDDTARIQRAINDINTKGGGTLKFATKTYLISSTLNIPTNKVILQGQNNAGTIIKANASMTNMISVNGIQRVYIRDIQLNGNSLASVGLYTVSTGQLWVDNLVVQKCTDKGVFLDNSTWMFNLNNCYILNNTNYGLYIGDDCAGSKLNMVVCEVNGINLRIGYSRMIQIHASTFQRYQSGGNVLIQAGWDITFDTCWFEATDMTLTGETYDLNLQPTLNSYIGHDVRILNCSFHGLWGATNTKSKHCIIDGYTDTVLQNNYIDGTNGGYTGGQWYENSNTLTKVVGLNNQIAGGQTYTLLNYTTWHTNVGQSADSTGFTDDQMLMISRIRVANRISFVAQSIEPSYDYDGRLYLSNNRKRMKFASDGKYWDMFLAGWQNATPTTGTYKQGDFVQNSTPISGRYFGWLCLVGGTPGTWVGIGQTTTLKDITANRPSTSVLFPGYQYFDTTLATAGKPIWWTGTNWVDSTGTIV